jgi:hypothetical protein
MLNHLNYKLLDDFAMDLKWPPLQGSCVKGLVFSL